MGTGSDSNGELGWVSVGNWVGFAWGTGSEVSGELGRI